MTSKGWIKLKNFRLSLKHKLKLKFAGLAFPGKIKAGYRYNGDDVVIYAEFDGSMLERVVTEFMEILKEWEKQNY